LKPFLVSEINNLIGSIYDCAIDPTLWAPTLSAIRDKLDMAYVHINFFDQNHYVGNPNTKGSTFQSEWPEVWFDRLIEIAPSIPGIEKWVALDIDQSRSQLQALPEVEFHQTLFYQEWVKPQGLRDYCYTNTAKRSKLTSLIGAASYASRDLISQAERDVFELLAPHVRRSLLISGILDEGKLQVQLYRKLLDQIGAGIIIVKKNGQLVYANAVADAMLSNGANVTVRQGRVTTASSIYQKGFSETLDRAVTGFDSDVGMLGNGIPLTGTDGSIAACYVLPLGKSDRRRELGAGLAALFITTHGASLPPAIEVLSALSGMTSSESRVALMVADGQSTADAAIQLGITINTLRKHLANVFDKTGTSSQLGLMKFVGDLSLPIATTQDPQTPNA
jgi:DNA-binding CsgD family transcriptional regulator